MDFYEIWWKAMLWVIKKKNPKKNKQTKKKQLGQQVALTKMAEVFAHWVPIFVLEVIFIKWIMVVPIVALALGVENPCYVTLEYNHLSCQYTKFNGPLLITEIKILYCENFRSVRYFNKYVA